MNLQKVIIRLAQYDYKKKTLQKNILATISESLVIIVVIIIVAVSLVKIF